MTKSSRHPQSIERIALVVLLTLIAWYWLSVLNRFDLWEDEYCTWFHASMLTRGPFLDLVRLDSSPPLYYALIGVLIELAGSSEWTLRVPSVLASIVNLLLIFGITRSLAGRLAGWSAFLLLALHPLNHLYALEARTYPLLLMMCLLQIRYLTDDVHGDDGLALLGLGSVTLIGCYLHFFGVLMLAASAAGVVLSVRSPRSKIRFLLSIGIAGSLFLPYVAWVFPTMFHQGGNWILVPWFVAHPAESSIPRVIEMLLESINYNDQLRSLGVHHITYFITVPAVIGQCILFLFALLPLKSESSRSITPLFCFWPGIPITARLLSARNHPFFLPGRHDFLALGALLIILGIGLSRFVEWIRRRAPVCRATGWVILAVICASIMMGSGLRLYLVEQLQENHLDLKSAQYLASHVDPNDRVYAMGIRRITVEYHLAEMGHIVSIRSFPGSTDSHPGWSDDLALLKRLDALKEEGRAIAEELDHATGVQTVWVLARQYDRNGSSVSVEWIIDHAFLHALEEHGWLRRNENTDQDLCIREYRRPDEPMRSY